MDLPEQALQECRKAAENCSPAPIDSAAMEELLNMLRPFFRAELEKGGQAQWDKDGPKMRAQGCVVGGLAWFYAALDGSPLLVRRKHLFLAFEFVKSGCDVRLASLQGRAISSELEMFTKYCAPADGGRSDASDYWTSVFGRQPAKSPVDSQPPKNSAE